ncbi:MAG: IS66 family transposase [Fibrobacteria bacterium]|nr:IS66 family transposase [Fibrobacteria bacterium]
MKVEKIEISAKDAQALLDRAKTGAITQDDYEIIKGLIDTHMLLNQAVANKNSSIKKLLQMIFGHKTEKTKNTQKKTGHKKKKTVKGHGKNAADDYTGAKTIEILHGTLKHCDPCPVCDDGKLYRQRIPGVVVRIKGTAPFSGTVYKQEKLRCNICEKVFTADLPAEAGKKKYDATAATMLALLRYGSGMPLNRIAKLQGGFGIPLSTSTQWDVTEKMADRIHPVYPALIKYAAQGDVIHNDDTGMKVLELAIANKNNNQKKSRTGIFTTGILSITEGRKIALFFTGGKHAGENMAQFLENRHSCLDPPIQMCDALSRNTSEDFKTILANCLTHGRRNFVTVADDFPDECHHVLETLGDVYHYDAITAEESMTPNQRLLFHQANSGHLMKKLRYWLQEQFDDKKVEPNSSLGKAINYMLNHWKELTLFLRVEKAPLDNNICERALKMAIMHRKNSLFYKTEHGAYIGDMFMSLIHTCALSKINPFEYLTALHKYTSAIFKNPHLWLPWNYQENLTSSA